MSTDSSFQSAAVILLREAFEGVASGQNYTWFVQGKEGMLNALESVDATRASRKPSPDCASIAAHSYHILYTLRGANEAQGRPRPEGSWEDTWKVQTVTDEEWNELRAVIRSEYEVFIAWFESNQDWSVDEAAIGSLASLPHLSFHLGAIRQILKVV